MRDGDPLPAGYERLRDTVEERLADPGRACEASGPAHEALAWCEEHLPRTHPERARALIRRARAAAACTPVPVMQVEGRYGWADVLWSTEALLLCRAHPDTHGEEWAAALAAYAAGVGRDDAAAAAEPLRERLGVLAGLRDPTHPELAYAHAQLASTLLTARRPADAVPHQRQALEILGRHPPDRGTALVWRGWAMLHEQLGDLPTAQHGYAQAAGITAACDGLDHPDYGRALLPLAAVVARRGPVADAAALVAQAEALLGGADPMVAGAWFGVSLAGGGLIASRRCLDADGRWIASGAGGGLDEAGSRTAVAERTAHADHHLRLLLATAEPDALAEAVAVAAWRRRLPDLVRRPWLVAGPVAEVRDLRRAVLGELATRELVGGLLGHAHRHDIDARFRAYVGHICGTRALWGRRATLRSLPVPPDATRPLASGVLDALRSRLAADERAVILLRAGPQYHALVVGADGRPVVAVPLGAAAAVDAAVAEARVALEGPVRATAFRDLLRPAAAGAADTAGLAGLLVEPLRPLLAGVRGIVVVTEGPLLHVPFTALPDGPSGGPLCATLQIDHLDTLDVRADLRDAVPGAPVVVAAPDFDLGGVPRPDALFTPLPGTAEEGSRIARLLPGATLLTGAAAVRSALRLLRSPRVLHVATHGYAFTGLSRAEQEELRRRAQGTPRERLPDHVQRICANPALQSGLALAGANTWFATGNPGPDGEPGLLTVADVAGLDLAGTDLVVLSACETGVGGIGPDGHESLRAAFLQAGARSVIASLWRVPDTETCELMVRFHELLADGLGTAEALRTAQREMRGAGLAPVHWAGFVHYGNPGPSS